MKRLGLALAGLLLVGVTVAAPLSVTKFTHSAGG